VLFLAVQLDGARRFFALTTGIDIRKLAKTFRTTKRRWGIVPSGHTDTQALREINLKVTKGERLGLLGPNGAGKTTLIKILGTLILPDSGRALVNGFDVVRQPTRVRASIGVVTGGERSIYYKLSGRENLILFGRLYQLPRSEAKERADELLGLMGLSEKADVQCEDYSTGMRMKIVFARSLLHDPPTLLFDEPTLGLDPAFARELREFIRDKMRDKCILLTTHYMNEADFVCDRIVLLHEGQIIASGTPAELKQSIREHDILTVQVAGVITAKPLEALPGVSAVSVTPSASNTASVRLHVNDGAAILRQLLDAIEDQRAKVLRFEFEEPTLDDVFIRKTGRRIEDHESEA
jgi:ABC-2 type transport system ATP-binding protein